MRKSLRRCRRAYLALLVLVGAVTVPQMFGQPILEWFEPALGGHGFALIYLGLLRRKAWVIPLIRMNAAAVCALCFATVLYPATTGKELGLNVFLSLLFLFFARQFLFFGTARVRAYLDDTGLVVF